MADDVTVSITAQTAELESALNRAAGTANSAFGQIKLSAAQAAQVTDQLRASAVATAPALASVGAASAQAASAHEGLRLATAGTTREFIVLGHEIMVGNFSRIPGSLLVMAERMGALGTITSALMSPIGALIAGVVALGAAFVYVARDAAQAATEIRGIQNAMILVGRGADFTTEKVKGWIDSLRTEFGMGRTEAASTALAMQAIPHATDAQRDALMRLVPAWAALKGLEPDKAAESIAKAVEGGVSSMLRLGDAVNAWNEDEKRALTSGEAHNNVMKATDTLIAALTRRLGDKTVALKENLAAEQKLSEEMAKGLMTGGSGVTAVPGVPAEGPGGKAENEDALALVDTENRYNRTLVERKQILTDIASLKRAITVDSDADLKATHEAELAEAQRKLTALDNKGGATKLEDLRTELAQELALSTQGHAEQAAETVAFWQKVLDTQKLSAKERETVERDLAVAQKQLRTDQLTFSLQTSSQQEKVDAEYYKTKEDQVRADFAAGKITADQEYAQLVDLEKKKTAAVVAALKERQALEAGDASAQSRIDSEILLAYAADKQAMISLDEKYFAQKHKLEEQDASSWKSAMGEILSAEDSLVRGIFSSRQSLTQSLISLGDQLVSKEIANDLKYLTAHMLYSAIGENDDKLKETGGILIHAIAEATKTKDTVAGEAQRTAAENTGQVGFIARIGQALARWLGLETSKTAATDAGEAARQAAQTAGAAMTLAPELAKGFAEIEIDASVGAAAAYADSAELGPEGLAAAPAVAAATYAKILGYAAGMGGGIAGFDQGAWSVPSDMIGLLHAGEQVIPTYAQGAANAGGGQSININWTVNAVDARSVTNLLNGPIAKRGLYNTIVRGVRDGQLTVPKGF